MIEQIKEALEKATPRPWSDNVFVPYSDVYSYNHQLEEPDELIAECVKLEDAHLISNAPRWLTYLLNELEKAQKEIEHQKDVDSEKYDLLHSVLVENEELRSEHTAMKEALEEIAEHGGTNILGKTCALKALKCLSTISNKEDATCTDSTSTEQES